MLREGRRGEPLFRNRAGSKTKPELAHSPAGDTFASHDHRGSSLPRFTHITTQKAEASGDAPHGQARGLRFRLSRMFFKKEALSSFHYSSNPGKHAREKPTQELPPRHHLQTPQIGQETEPGANPNRLSRPFPIEKIQIPIDRQFTQEGGLRRNRACVITVFPGGDGEPVQPPQDPIRYLGFEGFPKVGKTFADRQDHSAFFRQSDQSIPVDIRLSPLQDVDRIRHPANRRRGAPSNAVDTGMQELIRRAEGPGGNTFQLEGDGGRPKTLFKPRANPPRHYVPMQIQLKPPPVFERPGMVPVQVRNR